MIFKAIAHQLPSDRVTNSALIRSVSERSESQLSDQQRRLLARTLNRFLKTTGAMTRYHRQAGEKAVDFGVAAAKEALAKAHLRAEDIDLLIFVGVGRGFVEPATANVFQAALDLNRATCFDILDACASWLRGVDVAHHYLRHGSAKNVLIINCEFNFSEYVPSQIDSIDNIGELLAGFTIGEAATATILGADSGEPEYYASFRSLGAISDLCTIPLPHSEQFTTAGGRDGRVPLRFYSESSRLHDAAIAQLERQFLADERITAYDYDIIFGHAVSVPATLEVARRLRLDRDRHFEIFPSHGNTVSASIPLAMSLALEAGHLHRGHRVLLIMASAGVTTGYAAFTY